MFPVFWILHLNFNLTTDFLHFNLFCKWHFYKISISHTGWLIPVKTDIVASTQEIFTEVQLIYMKILKLLKIK